MSYIAPNTIIKLLNDCPLDNTYDHTIYFNSLVAQQTYFEGLAKYTFSENSYQRVNKGRMRLQVCADNIYDCNYLMFQNTSFGSKWFYAFITSVEYVSNVVSEIEYEIDVMQTWFFDYEMGQCFVEREHTVTDVIGEHIEPEGIEIGEYVFNSYSDVAATIKPLAVYMMIVDEDKEPDGTLYDGVYGGCTLYAFNSNDIDGIKFWLNAYIQKPESILGMYMGPVIAAGGAIDDGGTRIVYSSGGVKINGSVSALSGSEALDGYIPKNKKLYTFPYNFFHLDNSSGDELSLRYEFFTGLQPKWEINVPVIYPIECVLRPTNYKGSGEETLNCESLVLGDYPMCSWSSDTFKIWLANNALPIASSLVGGVASAIATGGAAGIGPIVSSITSVLQNGYYSSIQADISKGKLSGGNGNVSAGTQSFYGGRCSITAEYARIIDDYFNMFGYAVKRCKAPNRNARPHWNYVKTLGCTITGSVPSQDMNKICSIYNNGITFWNSGNEIGNYSLDNSPS